MNLKYRDSLVTKIVVITLFAVGSLPRFLILLGDIDFLVQFIPDDAFYYFQTARNIVNGYGSTFDGHHLTNGYHPLWMLLLLPLAATIHNPILFIKAVLLLGFLLNTVCAGLLYVLLRRITQVVWLAIVGTALYFLNRQVIFMSLNGLETGLASLLFMISLYLLVVDERVGRDSFHSTFLTGVVLGLLFLARTDTAFFVAAFVVIALISKSKRLWHGLLLIATMGLIVGPWLFWNWFHFGSFVQVSGFAVPYVLHENYVEETVFMGSKLGFSFLIWIGFLFLVLQDDTGFPLIAYQATIIYCFLVYVRAWRARSSIGEGLPIPVITAVCLLWLGGALLIFIHTFIRWYPRTWYFDQIVILSAVTLALALYILWLRTANSDRSQILLLINASPAVARAAIALLFLTATIAVTAYELKALKQPPFPHQVEMLDAAYWLQAHLQDHETASAFNAGIMGFFVSNRVINLDGVMNNAAYDAIVDRELIEFLDTLSVNYYVDYDPVMWEQYRKFLGDVENRVGMTLVHEIDEPNVDFRGDAIKIYRLNWRPSLGYGAAR